MITPLLLLLAKVFYVFLSSPLLTYSGYSYNRGTSDFPCSVRYLAFYFQHGVFLDKRKEALCLLQPFRLIG